jgi:tetratricopeptide (TPR) repeat protein
MAEDLLFQEAVEALRQGKKSLAKEKLTLLLKAEQENATYWVWMSAAVDTNKERIYCLQTALKLDPENAAAKRGLRLFGALPPDEKVEPFPVNRPRAWEQKVVLANEQPGPSGLKALTSNPLTRLVGIIGLGVVVCLLALWALSLPRGASNKYTFIPSATFTYTPTYINAGLLATPTFFGPTPLWMLLPATYTPTPLYVNTPRQPESLDYYSIARQAYEAGDWDAYIRSMQEITKLEPHAADVYYYIGEAYRLQGLHSEALKAYNQALETDRNFGAAYLGLARARLMQDPNAKVEPLLNEAIKLDPNFGEVYLERAQYYLNHQQYEAALADLASADQRLPNSPLVYLTYTRVYIAFNKPAQALASARKANQLDLTLLPVYLLWGQAAVLQNEYQEAIQALETYVVYKPENWQANALLGESYFRLKDYRRAIDYLDLAIPLSSNSSSRRQSLLFRGLSELELDSIDAAVKDLEEAYGTYPDSFDLNIALVRGYYGQGKFGTAYLKAEETQSLIETNEQWAQLYYWRAQTQEERGRNDDAVRDWNSLLYLPEEATTPALRAEALRHLKALITPTPTPRGGVRATGTPTPRAAGSRTATATPKP